MAPEKKTLGFKLLKHFRPVRLFIVGLGVVVSLLVVAIFLGIYYSQHQMIIQTVKGQASSYFDLIIKAREWNENHSGVYVMKKPGVETNPYLRQLGVEPDIHCTKVRVLTLRNPSLMTKEISKLTLNDKGTTFHITSLRLVNPDNAPDRFEREALKKFENGADEAWEIDRTGGAPVFRLIRPLKITAGCLNCHKDYALGDIRGGISVNTFR